MGCCHTSGMPYMQPALSAEENERLLESICFLRETPMFCRMKDDELPILARACKRTVFMQGEQVVTAGTPARQFYIIVHGRASMWIDYADAEAAIARRQSKVGSDAGRRVSASSMASAVRRLLHHHEHSSEASGMSSASRTGPAARLSVGSLSPSAALHGADRAGATSQRSLFTSDSSGGHGDLCICNLVRPDYFGERSLAFGDQDLWDTSIVADSPELICLSLTGQAFRRLELKEKLRIPKRRVAPLIRAARQSPCNAGKARAKVDKTPEEAGLLRAALSECETLRCRLDVDEFLLQALVDAAWSETFADGEEVVGAMSSPESCLLVVGAGKLVSVARQRRTSVEQEDCVHRVSSKWSWAAALDIELHRGAVYGAHTLLYDALHSAQVFAAGETVVWKITSADYADACKRARELKRDRHAEILSKVEAFSTMLNAERRMICRGIREETFFFGQTIYTRGSVGKLFYILIDGEVKLTSGSLDEPFVLRGSLDEPAAFGEHVLAQPLAEPAPSTVTVSSDQAVCCVLSRGMTVGRVSMIADIVSQSTGVFAYAVRKSKPLVEVESLKRLDVLGRGAFGFVELLQDPSTKELYALKTLKKARIARTEYMRKQVQNEKYILEMTDSPFITKLFQTGKTAQDIFFLLEACLGGELYTVYISLNLFGKEDHARYYCASVACAFEHLHERSIIYRDLKPENLLLTEEGRLKVADMGLAKFVVGETFTVCGTPSYFPPEQTQHAGYTNMVDWWQLGILAWELLASKTPFVAQSRGEALYWLHDKGILRGLKDSCHVWPKGITVGAKEFLRSSLDYDPSQRCMMLPSGAERSLRDNPWFGAFDWDGLEEGTLRAPFLPPPVNLKKVENFNNQVSNNLDNEEYVDDGTHWDSEF